MLPVKGILMTSIEEAVSPEHWDVGRRLILEYADSLGLELTFQSFEAEVADLRAAYGRPSGCLLLALEADSAVGCVAYRRLDSRTCEMKRLYVRPFARGAGIARRLAERAICLAREAGYATMRLDTLPSMPQARALYTKLGFRPIPPYRFNPVAGTEFLELAMNDVGREDS